MKPPRIFMLLTILLFCIIVILPIASMIIASFSGSTWEDWYHSLKVFDKRQILLAENSLTLGLGSTCLCLIIGVPLAILLGRTDLWGGRLFNIIYIVPIIIPAYIQAIVWTRIDPFLQKVFSFDVHSVWGCTIVLALSYFPLVTLMTLSGLKSIDRGLEEAALLCYGKFRTLAKITIPLVAPHIFSGAIFVFILSSVNFAVPDILRVRVYPVEIFVQFSAFYNEKAATLLCLPFLVFACLLIVLQKWWMRSRLYVQIGSGYLGAIRYSLGWFNALAFVFCVAILSLSMMLPVVTLFKIAGPISNYARVLNSSLGQIGYSLVLAASGALLAVVLSFSLFYFFERSKTKIKVFLELACFLPLAIPATAFGIGLIKTWNQPILDVVYSSSFIIVLGYVARFIPYSCATIHSGLKQIGPQLEEAAFLTCPQWLRVARKIVLPLLSPSLIAAFFIVFLLAFGELGTTLLIVPPGRETIPIKVYNLMHYGAEQMVAASCLLLIAIIFGLSGCALLLWEKFTKRTTA